MNYLACDLGAESGRVMLGQLEQGIIRLEEIHRFPNHPISKGVSLLWNIPEIMDGIKTGLKKAASRGIPVAAFSCDSWGVDYLLFDQAGELIPPTYHYRDPRSQAGVTKLYQKISWEQIYRETGIQFMPINTLFQLASEESWRWEKAKTILGIADGVNYLLSGIARVEESMASTFQVYNPEKRDWSAMLVEVLGIPPQLFPRIVPSGTRLGSLLEPVQKETGLGPVEVIASCSHDTGTAVAAVPAREPDWAFLSSGTWSLIGFELKSPLITEASREANFTNEIGYGGTVRFLKNIVGLWILQESRREWAREGKEYDYSSLIQEAGESTPFVSLINPNDPRFVSPGNMLEKIRSFCLETGQPLPDTVGATVRCILESLALLYAKTLKEAERVSGKTARLLHIVGGGSKNHLLNQFTADATGIPVLAGPVEATALGNILIQAIAMGELRNLAEAREVVARSHPPTTYIPGDRQPWQNHLARIETFKKSEP